MNACEYFDSSKSKLGIESDYALGKALGISHGRISAIRHHRAAGFDNETALKIAEILDIDHLLVIADMELSRKNANVSFWEGVRAKSAGTAAAIIATTVLCAIPSESVASVANTIDLTTDSNMYYARFKKWLSACSRKMFPSTTGQLSKNRPLVYA